MSKSLNVSVGNVNLKSPIILASGTCNFGRELAEYYDLNILGGISSKGLTIKPRVGNPGVRVAECDSGMLNSVGLQNPGVHYFIENDLDFMKESGAAVIVNVAGHSFEDYINMVTTLDPHKDKIDALEELGVRVAPISDRIGDTLIEVLKEHGLLDKCIVK